MPTLCGSEEDSTVRLRTRAGRRPTRVCRQTGARHAPPARRGRDKSVRIGATRVGKGVFARRRYPAETVIGEIEKIDAKKARRVIVCSGKVYYDLLAYRRESKIDDVAIVRLEQQYPFPHADFKSEIARYAKAKEVVWCQEEPQNQGAWYRLRAYLRADILDSQVLAYAGRSISASTAVGYASKHNAEQKQLIEDAFATKLASGEMVIAH